MGLLDSLFGTNKARRDLVEANRQANASLGAARDQAMGYMTQGQDAARNDILSNYGRADSTLLSALPEILAQFNGGYGQARGDITAGYDAADAATREALGQSLGYVDAGASTATAALDPYVQSGRRAQGLYDTALGLGDGGAAGAAEFYDNYAANDPYRAFNEEMANKSIMAAMNARGMGGSGRESLAVSRASLERGSQDLQTYLSRLERAGGQGLQAANASGQVATQAGNTKAGLTTQAGNNLATSATNRGTALGNNAVAQGTAAGNAISTTANNRANLATGQGNQLANLSSGTGSTLANLAYGYGQQTAGNTISLGNAFANTRTAPMQNLVNLAGTVMRAPMPQLPKWG